MKPGLVDDILGAYIDELRGQNGDPLPLVDERWRKFRKIRPLRDACRYAVEFPEVQSRFVTSIKEMFGEGRDDLALYQLANIPNFKHWRSMDSWRRQNWWEHDDSRIWGVVVTGQGAEAIRCSARVTRSTGARVASLDKIQVFACGITCGDNAAKEAIQQAGRLALGLLGQEGIPVLTRYLVARWFHTETLGTAGAMKKIASILRETLLDSSIAVLVDYPRSRRIKGGSLGLAAFAAILDALWFRDCPFQVALPARFRPEGGFTGELKDRCVHEIGSVRLKVNAFLKVRDLHRIILPAGNIADKAVRDILVKGKKPFTGVTTVRDVVRLSLHCTRLPVAAGATLLAVPLLSLGAVPGSIAVAGGTTLPSMVSSATSGPGQTHTFRNDQEGDSEMPLAISLPGLLIVNVTDPGADGRTLLSLTPVPEENHPDSLVAGPSGKTGPDYGGKARVKGGYASFILKPGQGGLAAGQISHFELRLYRDEKLISIRHMALRFQ